METLAIATTRNTWSERLLRWKRDGDEFRREMAGFARTHSGTGTIEEFSKKFWARTTFTLRNIRQHPTPIDTFAAFCHGTRRSLGLGYNVVNAGDLAEALAGACRNRRLTVVLYACSCGRSYWSKKDISRNIGKVRNRDGFAMRLADELGQRGVRAEVIAHLTAGHTTKNPYAVRITADPEIGTVTRTTIVQTKPRAAWRNWIDRLRNTALRFVFPFRKDSQINQEVQ